jgi:nicotinamidase-related amidase
MAAMGRRSTGRFRSNRATLFSQNRNSERFSPPNLNILRARNIDTVIIGGIATNFCCETTAREAHGREFNVVFLSDGTATFDLPSVEGALIHRNDVQKSTLATLAFGFAEVIATDVAIAKLRAS